MKITTLLLLYQRNYIDLPCDWWPLMLHYWMKIITSWCLLIPSFSIISHLFCQTLCCLCFNPFQLLKEINRTSVSRALRIRRQAGQSDPRAYVTAHFKTLPLEFTLGDGRNYGDFRNRPLQNGQEYVFFVLALLDLSDNVSKNTDTPTQFNHLNTVLFNSYVKMHKTISSSRLCTPPALILIPWPHRMWILSQSSTRKRVCCGWWGLCWLSSSSSASSSPFSSSRGKNSMMEPGRCKNGLIKN